MKPPARVSGDRFAVVVGQPIREISSAEALEAFRAKIPFLDARRSADYALGHVAGAWSLPIWESVLDERLTEFEAAANRPPEGALVLYCSGGSCEDSHLLASKLHQLGYRNLLIYRDGYPDWNGQGRPTATGATR
jgi:rhodanese-related sulfurtransferase